MVVGDEGPQHVPRAVMADPPSLVTFAPIVACVTPIAVMVGLVTVGAVAAADVVNESFAAYTVPETPAPSV